MTLLIILLETCSLYKKSKTTSNKTTSNTFCYSHVKFEKITDRIKKLGKDFLDKNSQDYLIKPLIENAKPSQIGRHSAVYKILNW